MQGERFEADEKNMSTLSAQQIEYQGYLAGKKYVEENPDKTLNFGITGANYLKGFLRGAEEQYNLNKSPEINSNEKTI